MKNKLIYIGLISFLFSSCSKMFGPGSLEKSADFEITLLASPGKTFLITVPGSASSTGKGKMEYLKDYDYAKDSSGNSYVSKAYIKGAEYFWGYYIYQNETNPYESFYLRGFTGRTVVDSSTPPIFQVNFNKQLSGFSQTTYSSTSDHFLNDSCATAGKTYYYRAAEVKRTFSCETKCQCSDTICSSPCSCSGSWDNDGTVDRVSAWVSAACLN